MSSWIEDMNKELREQRQAKFDVVINTDFEADVWNTLNEIATMLIEKNRKYGDSALNPVRIFSKADNVAQLHTRIDDKLSRIKNTPVVEDDEDAVTDLLGYLILLKVAQNNGA